MTVNTHFQTGSLVRARGRTWVVQNGSTDDWLYLRPLSGAEDEETALSPEFEPNPVELAVFPPPDPEKTGKFASAKLLYDALRLQLRHGAGPFRSFGSVNFEPRAYQLVPLMMALRMPTVRLLISDDVGIGKTIEAGLILRELYDRGEIQTAAVLCPPHLVDQWVRELSEHFNIEAEALTAGSAKRLDKKTPMGCQLTDAYPFLVVSLDYIKSERHREYFRTVAPDFLIVDEAHTCTTATGAKQLRFDLLKQLAADRRRHMVLLTATPHSGNEDAFYNLISLLDERFANLQGHEIRTDERIRQALARSFVQRRRKDIVEWQAEAKDRIDGFPVRLSTEITYSLTPEGEAFFNEVQNYCRELGEMAAKTEAGKQSVTYAVLSLLRCVSSSPAAAAAALSHRLGKGELPDEGLIRQEFSDEDDGEAPSDRLPVFPTDNPQKVKELIAQAEALKSPKKDAKLALLIRHVGNLLKDGFSPVIFCRFVATSDYVAEALAKAFPKAAVASVTGDLIPEERRERVEELGRAPVRILVATDCLSEGINLQDAFTAVVHYDMAWNPTRHEQREGRVDRFGQTADEVRCSLLWGQNNPVDGFILRVILRKSREIQKRLGVVVPVPEDPSRIQAAVVKAALAKKAIQAEEKSDAVAQASFDFLEPDVAELEEKWTNALEKMKRTRTVFAQAAIHPDEVSRYWSSEQAALGSHEDLEHFCREASAVLGAKLSVELNGRGRFTVPVKAFREKSLAMRFQDEGITAETTFNFKTLHRASPLPMLLAEAFMERAVAGCNDLGIERAAVTESPAVETVTRLFILRIRFRLDVRYRNELKRVLLAEEILPVIAEGVKSPVWKAGRELAGLISPEGRSNFPKTFAAGQIRKALDLFNAASDTVSELVRDRADALLHEHTAVKEFTEGGSVTEVTVCTPVDLMGVYVLLPSED